MLRLAWRNLLHDKVRLTVTLTGISFAVVLMVVELGLFVGSLGRHHTFILLPRDVADLHLPSDLAGVTPLEYNDQRLTADRILVLGPSDRFLRYVATVLPTLGEARILQTTFERLLGVADRSFVRSLQA